MHLITQLNRVNLPSSSLSNSLLTCWLNVYDDRICINSQRCAFVRGLGVGIGEASLNMNNFKILLICTGEFKFADCLLLEESGY